MARLKETLPCLVHTFALLLFCVGGESSVCHLGIPTLWTSLISIWDLWFELDLFFFTAQRHPSPLESIWLLSPVGPWTGSRRRLHDWSQQWSRSPSLEIEPVALFFFRLESLTNSSRRGRRLGGKSPAPFWGWNGVVSFFLFLAVFFCTGFTHVVSGRATVPTETPPDWSDLRGGEGLRGRGGVFDRFFGYRLWVEPTRRSGQHEATDSLTCTAHKSIPMMHARQPKTRQITGFSAAEFHSVFVGLWIGGCS